MKSVKDFRGKSEPPVEKGVLKIERYAQRLTQGYSAYGGSYLWAPGVAVGPVGSARSNGEAMYGRSLMLIAILNFGGIFGEFRAIHALSRAKSTS